MTAGYSPRPPKRTIGVLVRRTHEICSSEVGQGVAEYAAMLALILILMLGTVQLIGGPSKNIFFRVASGLWQQSDAD
jgi:Flp pilus assembly pilin Flp